MENTTSSRWVGLCAECKAEMFKGAGIVEECYRQKFQCHVCNHIGLMLFQRLDVDGNPYPSTSPELQSTCHKASVTYSLAETEEEPDHICNECGKRCGIEWNGKVPVQELPLCDFNADDKVNNPSHYTAGGIETIDYLEAKLSPDEVIGFCIGNVMKYISRARHKNGLEDLKKAQWYLNRAIQNKEKR